MKRFAAHYIYCSSSRILHKGVVELDNSGLITSFFSLDDFPEEMHSTEFFNGIIIPPVLTEIEIQQALNQSVFSLLDKKIALHPRCLTEGEQGSLFLLENLNLIELLFTKETVVRQLF